MTQVMADQKQRAPRARSRKRLSSEASDLASQNANGGRRALRKRQKVAPKDQESGTSSAQEAAVDGSRTVDDSSGESETDETGETGEKLKVKIDRSLKPISDPREMMQDMVSRLQPEAFRKSPIKLRVATICSGTDAPIFALNLLQDGLRALGYGPGLVYEQLFSCEIEPFKQGFIRRNLPSGTPIFRDVVEMARAGPNGLAMTAGGSKERVPDREEKQLDILFAGCSCVDYSNMNTNKPDGSVPSLDRHLKPQSATVGNAPKRARGKGEAGHREGPKDSSASPVALDWAFIRDLDPALDELLDSKAGESARTFFAAVKLINDLRPRFVVLENVCGAPWDMYTKHIFPKIGYVAKAERVDSKDFYVPQTRQRGYLVAIDAQYFGIGLATKIAAEWLLMLLKCKRLPSVAVTDFLHPSDDPSLVLARADMEGKTTESSDWAMCSLRHTDARHAHGLRRDENPFSNKVMRNGRLIYACYPSHSWVRFWQIQVPRIIDVMDIAFAVNNGKGCDLGFKTAMIDVSQNVDRNNYVRRTPAWKFGIVGCITPSGVPIITDHMRPVTGSEALALQGLPVDELVISTESQAQLRDLAGNAMTLTVVGAVTLCLLFAATKLAPDHLDGMPSSQPKAGLYLQQAPEEDDKSLGAGRSSIATIHVGLLLPLAEQMRRVCHCARTASEVFVCSACGATACAACRGNPVHDFGTTPVAGPELSIERGKVQLKRLLPNAVALYLPPSIIVPDAKGRYGPAVHDALAGRHVYYFDTIRVTDVVTVCYKAAKTIARLVLSPDGNGTCCWYLYFAPWHPERTQLSARFDVNQPIARGLIPQGAAVPQWSFWVPKEIKLKLQLTADAAAGALVASDLSFADDPGSDPSLLAWKRTVEQKVCGVYVHHPKCGTPGCALRIRQGSDPAAARVFMMWESEALRAPRKDHFVWTDTARRTETVKMEPHEYREVFLRATPALTWADVGACTTRPGPIDVFWSGYWSSSASPGPSDAPNLKPVGDMVRIHWAPTETIQDSACHARGQDPVTSMPVLATITATFRGFPMPSTRVAKVDARATNNDYFVFPANTYDGFLRLFAFLSAELQVSRVPADLADFPHLRGEWVPVGHCSMCSVMPPEIAVYAQENRKKGLFLIEDPAQAGLFERQYQELPRAVAVAARLLQGGDDGGGDGESTMDIRLLMQPKTLVSRALEYLIQAHPTASRGRFALTSQANTAFRVTLEFAATPSITGLAPFADSLRPCGHTLNPGIDLTKKKYVPPSDGPPRFCRDLGRGRGRVRVEHELRPSQKEAVIWMMQRELVPIDFVKSEIEEEVVAPLNLRVVGKAEWANSFPYSARGGVVAHDIGYGKTVVTLALLDYMREYDLNESVAERMEKVDGAWAAELSGYFKHSGDAADALLQNATASGPFFRHLSATLVIVPKHITDQWALEAEKFLGLKHPKVLIIKTSRSFYDPLKLKELEEAEIIILSSAVFTSGFMDRLQKVAGRGPDYPRGLPERALEIWYQQALRNQRILTACYLAGPAPGVTHDEHMSTIRNDVFGRLVERQQAEINELVGKQVKGTSRKDAKKGATKNGKRAAAKTAPEQQNEGDNTEQETTASKLEDHEWDISWLHNCSFARVIWDECSYDDDNHIRLFVANAAANAKWLISGTPKLFALEQVCKMAAVFGIHVARPEQRMMPGLPAVTEGPKLHPMTKSEEFHMFSSRIRSAVVAAERHSRGQAFVSSFFRANHLAEEVEIEVEELVVPVAMTASTAMRYHLLNQEVFDAGYDYSALPAHARDAVKLKGGDLVHRDTQAQAKMLLGLVACGLGRETASLNACRQQLSKRLHNLGDHMKLLWDKVMWLRRWVQVAFHQGDAQATNQRDQDALAPLARVDAMCDALTKALSGDRGFEDFEDFDGIDMFQHEVAVVAGQRQPKQLAQAASSGPDFLRAAWAPQFTGDWREKYSVNKALYTWIDFFHVDEGAWMQFVDTLTEAQLRLLAEDICWLRYKLDPDAEPLKRQLPDPSSFLKSALTSRDIPTTIDGNSALDSSRVLDVLSKERLQKFVSECMQSREKGAPRTWDMERKRFTERDDVPKSKQALRQRFAELNLHFREGVSIGELQKLLWQHENGYAGIDKYRDGRAAPDQHLQLAIAQDLEALQDELKRTMVHLNKTTDDFRTTWRESNFVTAYSSLACADDKDSVVSGKRCGGCHQPLESASSSFLVVGCGHFLCHGCQSAAEFYCPAKGCPAFVHQRPILPCSQVPGASDDEGHTKAAEVADFIKNRIPSDEYVLVFGQYGPFIDALEKAIKDAGVECLNLASLSDEMVSQGLEDFKAARAGRVLLLDMDSETSAGSNLTIASRIVFASPYMHHDEDHQVRTVLQARGRCIRTGQTNKVHVYHFMVSGTIEEENLRKFGRVNPAVKKFFGETEEEEDDEVAGTTDYY
ncbi:uncharacterized protein B0T15DRAFT_195642 [Chaetomium strumarium]|uniref:RING-type domain-containing protein n=1 Tax=Chaetomium strumarium TaxID=1170767 RepID=A0AAJ0M1G2_9PEZI|nr:hypothetical protein B0T15DRAFT_195642 [Chaetomium strumarium]